MCGIAGIMFKHADPGQTAGTALVDMLDGCQHRGKDSTGFALYHKSTPGQLHLRFFVGDDDGTAAAIGRVRNILEEFRAVVVEDETIGKTYRAVVEFDGDVQKFAYALEHGAKLISIGSSLDIIKDIGTAHDVDESYHIGGHQGTHGIGHVRLATESDVKPESAHPFWATGFADIAIVHNGQITNYWKMRRRLEQRGFEFRTENDSELIAVFLAEQLSHGIALETVLEQSIDILDGTFSFLVSTDTEIGYAKDRLAAKPMIMYESDELIAIASEEVSLNRLFPGETLDTREPLPGTFATWSKST